MSGLFGGNDNAATSDAWRRQQAANALPPSGATNPVRDNRSASARSIAASGLTQDEDAGMGGVAGGRQTLGGGGRGV